MDTKAALELYNHVRICHNMRFEEYLDFVRDVLRCDADNYFELEAIDDAMTTFHRDIYYALRTAAGGDSDDDEGYHSDYQYTEEDLIEAMQVSDFILPRCYYVLRMPRSTSRFATSCPMGPIPVRDDVAPRGGHRVTQPSSGTPLCIPPDPIRIGRKFLCVPVDHSDQDNDVFQCFLCWCLDYHVDTDLYYRGYEFVEHVMSYHHIPMNLFADLWKLQIAETYAEEVKNLVPEVHRNKRLREECLYRYQMYFRLFC